MLSVLDNNHENKNIEESGLQQIALNESLENLLLDPDFDSILKRVKRDFSDHLVMTVFSSEFIDHLIKDGKTEEEIQDAKKMLQQNICFIGMPIWNVDGTESKGYWDFEIVEEKLYGLIHERIKTMQFLLQ